MAKISARQLENEPATEAIADSVIAISAAIKKLRAGRLNDRAIIVLLQGADNSLSVRSIKAVFDGLQDLEKNYIRKKP